MPININVLKDTSLLNVEIRANKVRFDISLVDWWSWSSGFVKEYQMASLFNVFGNFAWGVDEEDQKYYRIGHYAEVLDVVLWDINLEWGNSGIPDFTELERKSSPTTTINRDASEFWDEAE